MLYFKSLDSSSKTVCFNAFMDFNKTIVEKIVHSLMTSSNRLSYITGLDGIRAVAVMAVLFYHADLPWALGGFLGVETFFVLSGFLITLLLLAEWQSPNEIDLQHFWLRRARRLLPATL